LKLKPQNLVIIAIIAFAIPSLIKPANAVDVWGEIWNLTKSKSSSIRYHTVGKHFTQKWITSYDANYMKQSFGGEAQGTSEDWCYNDIKKRGGRYIIPGVDVVVREENGKMNCYFRHWK
jgi:hypothetical protein